VLWVLWARREAEEVRGIRESKVSGVATYQQPSLHPRREHEESVGAMEGG
jgi:hypothetical protein